jgi:hypothetical protein
MPNSIASAKTEVVPGGGTEPDWDGGKGQLLELIPGGEGAGASSSCRKRRANLPFMGCVSVTELADPPMHLVGAHNTTYAWHVCIANARVRT